MSHGHGHGHGHGHHGHGPSAAPTAGPYVAKKLRELDVALGSAIPRVLEDRDEEAIHDLRVSIRRLRTMLKMARPLLGRWHADVVRRAFAEVMRATGELRDEEVLEETLEHASDHEGVKQWIAGRATREERLRKNVVLRIQRGDLDRARLLLKALLVFPIKPSNDIDLARFARRTVERARRTVEAGRDIPPEDTVGLHDLRISYKELRYSIELLAEALPLDARAMLEPSAVFQKRLGEIHDVDVAIDTVTKARNLDDSAKEDALAKLAVARAKKLAKYLRELDPLGAEAAEAAAKVEEAKAEAGEVASQHGSTPGAAPPNPAPPPAAAQNPPSPDSADDAPTHADSRATNGAKHRNGPA